MTRALKSAQSEAKAKEVGTPAPIGSVSFEGVDFVIQKRPNTLLLSELALIESGSVEAMGALSEFFKVTLGSNYPAFRSAIYASDSDDVDADLRDALKDVLEVTMARPTE